MSSRSETNNSIPYIFPPSPPRNYQTINSSPHPSTLPYIIPPPLPEDINSSSSVGQLPYITPPPPPQNYQFISPKNMSTLSREEVGASGSDSSSEADLNEEIKRIEDLDMPPTLVNKLISNALGDGTMENDARLAIVRSTTVFIGHLARSANMIAKDQNHKTIHTDDVFKAIEACNLGEFLPRLKTELNAFEVKRAAAKAKHAENNDDDIEFSGGPPSSSVVINLPSDNGVIVKITNPNGNNNLSTSGIRRKFEDQQQSSSAILPSVSVEIRNPIGGERTNNHGENKIDFIDGVSDLSSSVGSNESDDE